MADHAFLAALGATVLLGAVLFSVLLAERRRKSLAERLAAISSVGRRDDRSDIPLSLRRAVPRTGSNRFYLLPAALGTRLDAALEATGNRVGLGQLIAIGLLAAAVAIGFTEVMFGFPPAVAMALGGVAALAGPTVFLRLAQARYRRRFLADFPDAIDLVGRAIRAGLPVLDALDLVAREIPAPVGSEFRRTLDEAKIGVDLLESFRSAAERTRVPDFQFFVVSLTLQRRTGGALSGALGNLSAVIRGRNELRTKSRALASEAKASAWVLGSLPAVVGAILSFVSPGLMAILIVDPRGRMMLGAAILSLICGVVVMATAINKSVE